MEFEKNEENEIRGDVRSINSKERHEQRIKKEEKEKRERIKKEKGRKCGERIREVGEHGRRITVNGQEKKGMTTTEEINPTHTKDR